MQLQSQPNSWSCLPTAFAMALDTPVESLIEAIGHDGSTPFWMKGQRQRGFHVQELVDLCLKYNVMVTCIDCQPLFVNKDEESRLLWDDKTCNSRFMIYLSKYFGVLVGRVGFTLHAVAWDGHRVYDPNGSVVLFRDYTMQYMSFYIVGRV